MTTLQAFNAMQKFLDYYFHKKASDHLAPLLGSMLFLEDGKPLDPALWEKWIKLIGLKKNIPVTEAYIAMLKFLDHWFSWCTNNYVEEIYALLPTYKGEKRKQEYEEYNDSKKLLEWLKHIKLHSDSTIDHGVWAIWIKCVEESLNEPEGSRQYLELIK